MYAKCHHNIPLSLSDRTVFTFFRFWSSAKLQPMKKCHFAISWPRSCQYQCLRKSLSKYSIQFKRKGYFHFFKIWRSVKLRPMINVISQPLGLDFVNINAYAKFYQNIPNGLRVIYIFHEQVGDKVFTNCSVTNQMFDYRAHYESQPSVSVDFLRVVQFGMSISNELRD